MYQRLKAVFKAPTDETRLKQAAVEISSLLPLNHNIPFLGLALGIVARLEYMRSQEKTVSNPEYDEDMGETI